MLGDGSVMKVTTTKGAGWDVPKDLCACEVVYTVCSAADESVELAAETAASFKIDELEAPLALLEAAVRGPSACFEKVTHDPSSGNTRVS